MVFVIIVNENIVLFLCKLNIFIFYFMFCKKRYVFSLRKKLCLYVIGIVKEFNSFKCVFLGWIYILYIMCNVGRWF